MTTTADYALVAGAVYISSRLDANKLPAPPAWNSLHHKTQSSGLEAITYRNPTTGEVVIAFAGTQNARDWVANFGMGSGVGSDQLREAAAYVLTVMAEFPGARISFTGHSLGGGLASLMGVFFNRPAVTFDQAPFANSATTASRDDIVRYLEAHGFSFGGRDDDLIVGGAGDDTIEGDQEVWTIGADWSVSREVQTTGDLTTYRRRYDGGVDLDRNGYSGNDTIHAGGNMAFARLTPRNAMGILAPTRNQSLSRVAA